MSECITLWMQLTIVFAYLQKGSGSEDDMEEDGSFEASPPPREKTTGRRAASKVNHL